MSRAITSTARRGRCCTALRGFRGIGLVVSHDRALLDGLTSATLRLEGGRATHWPLPYSEAQAAWSAADTRAVERHELKQRSALAQQRRLVMARVELEHATRNRSTGHRMRNPHDSDARGLGARLERVRASLGEDVPHFLRGGPLHIEAAACPSPLAARLHLEVLRAGPERVVLEPAHLDLARGRHLAIEGQNGAGKSTLLAALRDACTLPAPLVWCLTQNEPATEGEARLAALAALPREQRGRVLQWVDCLGADPHHLLRSRSASPGEARKLRLAMGLSAPRTLLLLDEPTNHLDLPASSTSNGPSATSPAQWCSSPTTPRWRPVPAMRASSSLTDVSSSRGAPLE